MSIPASTSHEAARRSVVGPGTSARRAVVTDRSRACLVEADMSARTSSPRSGCQVRYTAPSSLVSATINIRRLTASSDSSSNSEAATLASRGSTSAIVSMILRSVDERLASRRPTTSRRRVALISSAVNDPTSNGSSAITRPSTSSLRNSGLPCVNVQIRSFWISDGRAPTRSATRTSCSARASGGTSIRTRCSSFQNGTISGSETRSIRTVAITLAARPAASW